MISKSFVTMTSIYMADYVGEVPVGENGSGSDVEFELRPFVMLPEIISLDRSR